MKISGLEDKTNKTTQSEQHREKHGEKIISVSGTGKSQF